MSNFEKIFGNSGRKFSAIKARMSITSLDGDHSPPGLLKARSRRRGNTAASEDSIPEIESLNRSISRSKTKTMRSMTITSDPDERPGSEELNMRFEKMMEEMVLPEVNKTALRKQNDDKKWTLVQQHEAKNKKKSSENKQTDARNAFYWIKKMQQRNNKGVPVFTHKDALTMQSVFRTSHKDFLADFIQDFAGVKALNRLTGYYSNLSRRKKTEKEILSTLIESYKLLMNNEIGMKGVLLVPESVRTIAMAMDFFGDNYDITEKVVTLLSVACWWDEEGRRRVMSAMKYLKTRYRELSTFQTVAYMFQHNNNVHFKASIATFITTVCNTPPSIELRVSVRNHFFRLDIIKIFEKVLSKKPDKIKSADEEQGWKTIETQFEVFVAMMKQDQKEIVHKLIRAADKDDSHFDLSNLQDSWKILQKNALKADCQDQLLNVVQALFLVPTVGSLAAPIYESIAKFAFEATSIEKLLLGNEEKKGLTDPPELNYSELSKLLKHKIEYDAKVETFAEREGLVKRQQKLIRILQRRLVDVNKGVVLPENAMQLQKELIKHQLLPQRAVKKGKRHVRKKGSTSKQSSDRSEGPVEAQTVGLSTANGMAVDLALLAGLGITDSANEIEIMKEKEAKYKKEIDKLQKQVQLLSKGGKLVAASGAKGKKDKNDPAAKFAGKLDSTGLAPAGIATGKTKKEPPAVPAKGMPGSLENAPVEYNPAKPKLNLPSGKPKGGKPGAPGGGLAALFAGVQTAKPRKNMKAEKYKQALEKLGLPPKAAIKPKVKMTQVFWNVINPDKLENTIWPELSDQNIQFNTDELEQLFSKKQTEKKKEKKKDESELIKIIDGRRRQNVAIALKKLKLPIKEIVDGLTSIDPEVLSPDRIQVFIDTSPTNDELTLLSKFTEDKTDPAKLANEEKYLYSLTSIPNLQVRLQCLKTSFTFVQDAKRIHSVIVKMQKALAEVSKSGELRKILEVVLAIGNYMNGGTTRGSAWGFKLDILGNLINVKDSMNNGTLMHYLYVLFERNYPDLTEFSLPGSALVVNISFKEVIKEMNGLAKQVGLIRQEVKKKPFSKHDKFSKVIGPFEVKATKDVENLQKMLEQVRKDFEKLAIKFGESGNDVEPKTLFPKLVSFEQGLKRAGNQLVEMREADARKQKVEEQKYQRNTVRKLKKLLQASTNEEGMVNMDLIEMFKSQQNLKTNEVVDKFLAKYQRDQDRNHNKELMLKRALRGKKIKKSRSGH